MKQKLYTLFSYGANMDLTSVEERGLRYFHYEPATLRGYKRVFNKASMFYEYSYANIEVDSLENVTGLLSKITFHDLKMLDRYEGYPNHYFRKVVNVEKDNGEIVKAITYIATPKTIKNNLSSEEDYLAQINRGLEQIEKMRRSSESD
jgi:gamma-glutamylcyclotransferase